MRRIAYGGESLTPSIRSGLKGSSLLCKTKGKFSCGKRNSGIGSANIWLVYKFAQMLVIALYGTNQNPAFTPLKFSSNGFFQLIKHSHLSSLGNYGCIGAHNRTSDWPFRETRGVLLCSGIMLVRTTAISLSGEWVSLLFAGHCCSSIIIFLTTGCGEMESGVVVPCQMAFGLC